jgi:YVTN family beta-propeller protein
MVVATILIGIGPGGLAVTPDGSKVYVANGENAVSVIATATNTVIGSPIPVGSDPLPFGVFIQPRFAGRPGHSNCHGQSVAALARTFGGLNAAATALGLLQRDGTAKCHYGVLRGIAARRLVRRNSLSARRAREKHRPRGRGDRVAGGGCFLYVVGRRSAGLSIKVQGDSVFE